MSNIILSYTRDVYCSNEYLDNIPDKAIINLTKGFIDRIKKIKRYVLRLEVACITDYDNNLEFKITGSGENELSEWDGRWENQKINIYNDFFCWEFNIKHTDYTCSTAGIYFKELNENLRAVYGEKETLEKMLKKRDLYDSSRDIIEIRRLLYV